MNRKARLFFAGDFCSRPSTEVIKVADSIYDLINSCDLRIVNFEVSLKPDCGRPNGANENFYQHDDVPCFLKSLGFNVFPLANNHIFDWGESGYEKVVDCLGKNSTFGSGTYDEAYKVKVVEVNGLKIGFLAFSFASSFGCFNDVLNHDGLGCAYINDLKVNHAIIDARKEVDYLIVLPHDGIEYVDAPMPETIGRYRDFVEYGADAVIGTHPHCPQGWELYKGKPVFYSLGNFFFNSKEDISYRAWNRPHWYEGICVVMELSDAGIHFEVVNTLNDGNVNLLVDESESRIKHNEVLCDYLKNEDSYLDYINSVSSMVSCQEFPILDESIYYQNTKQFLRTIVQRWALLLTKGKKKDNDLQLCSLLRNDLKRNILIRKIVENRKTL